MPVGLGIDDYNLNQFFFINKSVVTLSVANPTTEYRCRERQPHFTAQPNPRRRFWSEHVHTDSDLETLGNTLWFSGSNMERQ